MQTVRRGFLRRKVTDATWKFWEQIDYIGRKFSTQFGRHSSSESNL